MLDLFKLLFLQIHFLELPVAAEMAEYQQKIAASFWIFFCREELFSFLFPRCFLDPLTLEVGPIDSLPFVRSSVRLLVTSFPRKLIIGFL